MVSKTEYQSLLFIMKIDVVQLALRKSHKIDIHIPYTEIYTASYAASLFCEEIGSLNIEHVAMLALDNTYKIINYFTVSMGEINTVKVSLAQIFRCALLSNASKIIIAHNHPSGVVEITSKDIEMTKKIAFFANSFSIELLDSFVVTADDYASIRVYCKEYMNDPKNNNKD